MKKKMVSVLLAAAMGTTALVGFGTTAYADDDVLEFYHGYYQDESEWAAAQVMRDIYDEFAKEPPATCALTMSSLFSTAIGLNVTDPSACSFANSS